MSQLSGASSRRQRTTIVLLAIALALAVGALVVSLIQLTNEKHAIKSATDNAQVVTKEIAADSDQLNQAISANTTAVADVSNQANGVAQSTGTLKTDSAAQAKALTAMNDASTKVQTELTNLVAAVQGIGSSIAAQQNASTALVTLVTDLLDDPAVGIAVLSKDAGTLNSDLNALVNSKCAGGGSCTLTAADFTTVLAESGTLATGLATQSDALAKNDPAVSAIAAAKALNAGLTDIQSSGTAAATAGKTLQTDLKAIGTSITAAATSATKLSDNAGKTNDAAVALSKSAAAIKQSSSALAAEGTTFNRTIQSLSSGTYTPDLVELSVPLVVLISLAGAMALLVIVVIWLAVGARRSRES